MSCKVALQYMNRGTFCTSNDVTDTLNMTSKIVHFEIRGMTVRYNKSLILGFVLHVRHDFASKK